METGLGGAKTGANRVRIEEGLQLEHEGSGNGGVAGLEVQGSGGQAAADGCGERICGRVKWFDLVKGYGFVTPDDGGGDIMVHYNLLGPLGRKSLPEGAVITVLVRQGPRGRQAAEILDLDLSKAIGPDLDRVAERNPNRVDPLDFVGEAGDFEPVEVRWFNRAKGYGFLLRDDGVTQVFV
ncbi:MAG: cold-shock protein, partial [Sandaracinobacteroides sp.]